MFIEKLNFSLSCCIRWTMSIVSLKLVAYIVQILTYRFWKFGTCVFPLLEYRIFLSGLFLLAHPVHSTKIYVL